VKEKTDVELLREHLAGGSDAFEVLIRRYSDELFGFLCRFVGNAAAADDVIQEAFVQVHLAAESFDQSRAFRPWLYTIAANKARDHLRSRARRHEYSLDAAGTDESGTTGAQTIDSGEASLSDEAERDEQSAAVRAVVDEMPDHLRLILVLGYFQQLPYAQIADVLEIPVGTVKSRLHAAVNQFGKVWRSKVGAASE
jgi:RNA polymerase sigma-70 factor (ECF subfamily)